MKAKQRDHVSIVYALRVHFFFAYLFCWLISSLFAIFCLFFIFLLWSYFLFFFLFSWNFKILKFFEKKYTTSEVILSDACSSLQLLLLQRPKIEIPSGVSLVQMSRKTRVMRIWTRRSVQKQIHAFSSPRKPFLPENARTLNCANWWQKREIAAKLPSAPWNAQLQGRKSTAYLGARNQDAKQVFGVLLVRVSHQKHAMLHRRTQLAQKQIPAWYSKVKKSLLGNASIKRLLTRSPMVAWI